MYTARDHFAQYGYQIRPPSVNSKSMVLQKTHFHFPPFLFPLETFIPHSTFRWIYSLLSFLATHYLSARDVIRPALLSFFDIISLQSRNAPPSLWSATHQNFILLGCFQFSTFFLSFHPTSFNSFVHTIFAMDGDQ